jgi:peptidoglycan-N-acetylglucosamine deacetylase
VTARRRLLLAVAAASAASLIGYANFCRAAESAGQACFRADQLAARPMESAPRSGLIGSRIAVPQSAIALQAEPSPIKGSIRRVDLPPGAKLVAFSFDLCEAAGEVAGYDGEIVDLLRSEAVKATFFAGGKWLVNHHERGMQLLADPHFEVGNHSWSHVDLAVVSGPAMQDQVTGPENAYNAVRGDLAKACPLTPTREPMNLFRFPYGSCSPQSLAFVNAHGYRAIQWDVDSGDPGFGQSAEHMAKSVLARVRPGSIILMHANGRGHHTAQALAMIIPSLRADGYSFVTISELLAAGTPVVAAGCYSERPGDTEIYDRKWRAWIGLRR